MCFNLVISQKNGLAVVVRINDRLPIYSKRQIDLSRAAATRIEMIQDGLAKVRIEAVDLGQLEKLVEYYADKEHPGLRIRPYYQGIVVLKRELNLNLVRISLNYIKIFPTDFQLVKN
ncbi:RlpA-like double-psi beta-barrel domain-containing protein [Algoriphagus sp.]|uniref:RlpA-like double-psi beta-barrel domain-containing protein n=1 Tax=Algoriphagus sp. TaxID=1872435 RepID=UPI00391A4FB4